jgi:hypothetical protein
MTAQPGAGASFSQFAFTADSSGTVTAINLTNNGTGDCDTSSKTISGASAGRVVVFPCSGCSDQTDEIYVLTTTDDSSQLYHLTYSSEQGLTQSGPPLSLPWGTASGLAVESTSLPARLAISFGGGGVGVVQIGLNANMSLAASAVMPGGPAISDAPYWCHCPASNNVIGVGAQNGVLYLLDTSLNTIAAYPTVGAAISATPGADGGGDWFFGADDGNLYGAPAGQSNVMVVTRSGGVGNAIRSGVQAGGCLPAICIYFGALNDGAYLVKLDGRDAVVTACIGSPPLSCSGQNPRLWARVEVDTALTPPAVHVQGWSYYSP